MYNANYRMELTRNIYYNNLNLMILNRKKMLSYKKNKFRLTKNNNKQKYTIFNIPDMV